MQTPEDLKTRTGEEAFNPDGLVQRSIRLLKDKYPDLEVETCFVIQCLAHMQCSLHLHRRCRWYDACNRESIAFVTLAMLTLPAVIPRSTQMWRWTPTIRTAMTALCVMTE